MTGRRGVVRFGAFVSCLAVVLGACGSSSKQSGAPPSSVAPKHGGTLIIGAEQEPDCMDWIASCAGSSWGTWLAEIQTIPYAYRTVPANDKNTGDLKSVPSPVLTGEAKLETTPVQKLTYTIAPEAVWSDGVPITCADFAYTVDQQQHGTDLYDQTGYLDIAKVDCSHGAKTVIVTWKPGTSYASWKALFSGTVGILPSHILQGKNRDALMKDGYSWSGGPWIAKWNKGVSIQLTHNPKWWGTPPVADKVVFQFLPDTAAEFEAFKSGQVLAIYPQPQIDVVDAISAGGLTDSNSLYNSNTATVEAIWFNNSKAPFNSTAVRQAVAYAIDRDALVKKLFGKLGVDKAVNSMNPYVARDYSNPDATAKYHLDLDMVNKLMTGDGWAKGSDGVWAKSGQRASFTINSTVSNKRRELTEEVLQQQLKDAGFEMKIKNLKVADIFGEQLPKGNFQIALYANNLTALTPGLCTLFCSKNNPDTHGGTGNNWTRTNVPAADAPMEAVDNNLDESTRMADGKKADDLLAADMNALPLDPLPDILLWSKKLGGPIQDNSIEGMFWNIDKWGLAS